MVRLKQVFRRLPAGIFRDHESPDSSWSKFQTMSYWVRTEKYHVS